MNIQVTEVHYVTESTYEKNLLPNRMAVGTGHSLWAPRAISVCKISSNALLLLIVQIQIR